MKFRKRPVVIEAFTFDELVAYGIANCGNAVNGMPWSFTFRGHAITHENDDTYLIPTLEGTMRMGRGDMLVVGVKGEIYPCKTEIFAATNDAEPDVETPKPKMIHYGVLIEPAGIKARGLLLATREAIADAGRSLANELTRHELDVNDVHEDPDTAATVKHIAENAPAKGIKCSIYVSVNGDRSAE